MGTEPTEEERLAEEARLRELQQSSWSLGDILKTGFWGVVLAGIAGLAIAVFPQFREFVGGAGDGFQSMINHVFRAVGADAPYQGAERRYFESEEIGDTKAAEILSDAVSELEGLTIGASTIEQMTRGVENRQITAQLLERAGFNWNHPDQVNPEIATNLFIIASGIQTSTDGTALSDAERAYFRRVLDAAIVDANNMSASNRQTWVDQIKTLVGWDSTNPQAATTTPFENSDVMAGLLKNYPYQAISLIGVMSGNDSIRTLLESHQELLEGTFNTMSHEQIVAMIESLKNSQNLTDLLNEPNLVPLKDMIFSAILADNSIEAQLSPQLLQSLGLVNEQAPEAQVEFMAAYLAGQSDITTVTDHPELRNLSNLDHIILALRGQFISRDGYDNPTGQLEDMTEEQMAQMALILANLTGVESSSQEPNLDIFMPLLQRVVNNTNIDNSLLTEHFNNMLTTLPEEAQIYKIEETDIGIEDTEIGFQGHADTQFFSFSLGAIAHAITR